MRVLFSPIGKSDPLMIFGESTGDNHDNQTIEVKCCYDASFLHIARFKRPDKIIMYMSSEICEYSDLDNRYVRSVELLNEMLGTNIEVETVCRRDLKNVHHFDFFYDEFEKIINGIVERYGEDTEIIFNVSSGTPAMKSALQVIASLSKHNITPVQVPDPTKGELMRAVNLLEYKLDDLWERYKENNNITDRTRVSENDNLIVRIQKEILKSFIRESQYDSAHQLAVEYKNLLGEDVVNLVDIAWSRYKLDFNNVKALRENYPDYCFLLKDTSAKPEFSKIYEYVLVLLLQIKQERFVDFIRGLTPFMYESSKLLLKSKYHIDMEKYCEYDGTFYLKVKKLKSDKQGVDILKALNNKYGIYHDKFLSEKETIIALRTVPNVDPYVMKAYGELEDLRAKKRNIASHQITRVLKSDFNTDLKDISVYIEAMKTIMKALNRGNDVDYDAYDKMNEYIINKIK